MWGFEITLLFSVLFLFVFFLLKRGKVGPHVRFTDRPRPTYEDVSFPSSSFVKTPKTKTKKKRKLPMESKGEVASKQALEKIFGKPFYKVRPEFLTNPITKKPLELDCYNDELKLAVEVQGEGHYHYLPVFHKNYQHFLNQKYRDQFKREKCKEMGIMLIEVPYVVKPEMVEYYLRKQLTERKML